MLIDRAEFPEAAHPAFPHGLCNLRAMARDGMGSGTNAANDFRRWRILSKKGVSGCKTGACRPNISGDSLSSWRDSDNVCSQRTDTRFAFPESVLGAEGSPN